MIDTIIEMVFDTILAVLGVALIIRAQDNQLRRIWGVLVLVFAISMVIDNIYWLKYETLIIEQNLTLLSLPLMLKWYLFTHVQSLFTVGSLKPNWPTTLRLIAVSMPFIITVTVAMCYMSFNGYITPLPCASDILHNLSHTDVQVRLAVFLLSIITPMCNILFPLVGIRAIRRKFSNGMYFYISVFLVLACAYVIFTLSLTSWINDAFGFIIVILPIILSILFLRNENPLSSLLPTHESAPAKNNTMENSEETPDLLAYKLYERIAEHMRTGTPFTDPDYSLIKLTKELGASRTLTSQALKHGGFIGFREYVSYLRLEHFKYLAATKPGMTIKELMFRSGFTSRSSFYRHFGEQESISPREYLEKLYNKPTQEKE